MPAQGQTYARAVDAAAETSEALMTYLRSLPGRHLASQAVASAAEGLWRQLRLTLSDVAAPNCVPMDDGGLRFSWIKDGRYLDAEIAADGRYEWFFRDRAAGITEDGEASTGAPPSELLSRLRALYS
jgi:hypothetical protein